MSGRAERRAEDIEERLRGGVPGARRDPSPALRARVVEVLESAPRRSSDSVRTLVLADAPALRDRAKAVFAAATVLLAAGFWILALFGVLRGGSAPAASIETAAPEERTPGAGGLAAIERLSPAALEDLARDTPRALSAAVDDSLFAEIADIAEDATRAARFLVGRLPPSLAGSALGDSASIHRGTSLENR